MLNIIFYILGTIYFIINNILVFFTDIFIGKYQPVKLESMENYGINISPNKCLTWNIHYGRNISYQESIIDIINFINKSEAAIVGLQEVVITNDINQVDIIKKYTRYKYVATAHSDVDHCNLILSYYPILETKIFYYNNWGLRPRKNLLAVLVDHPEKKYWFINTHLSHDFTHYEQKCQIEELIEYINALSGPKIIAGDFNSHAKSNNISIMSQEYTNNINKNISTRTSTFPSNNPIVLLDYIFSQDCQVKYIDIVSNTYSDHCPIIFELE